MCFCVFLLSACTCLGHGCQDFLNLRDGIHASRFVFSSRRIVGSGVRTQGKYYVHRKIPSTGKSRQPKNPGNWKIPSTGKSHQNPSIGKSHQPQNPLNQKVPPTRKSRQPENPVNRKTPWNTCLSVCILIQKNCREWNQNLCLFQGKYYVHRKIPSTRKSPQPKKNPANR